MKVSERHVSGPKARGCSIDEIVPPALLAYASLLHANTHTGVRCMTVSRACAMTFSRRFRRASRRCQPSRGRLTQLRSRARSRPFGASTAERPCRPRRSTRTKPCCCSRERSKRQLLHGRSRAKPAKPPRTRSSSHRCRRCRCRSCPLQRRRHRRCLHCHDFDPFRFCQPGCQRHPGFSLER